MGLFRRGTSDERDALTDIRNRYRFAVECLKTAAESDASMALSLLASAQAEYERGMVTVAKLPQSAYKGEIEDEAARGMMHVIEGSRRVAEARGLSLESLREAIVTERRSLGMVSE